MVPEAPPNWVDHGHPLGRLINGLLAVELLRRLLFLQARQMIIRRAEKRGIAGRPRCQPLQHPAEPLLAEAARLRRPGVIRRLPAPIATLLKSTESCLEDDFRLNLPEELTTAGLEAVRQEACDPRHRGLVAGR